MDRLGGLAFPYPRVRLFIVQILSYTVVSFQGGFALAISKIINHTQAQAEEWSALCSALKKMTGSDVPASQIAVEANNHVDEGHDTRAGYELAIRLAKQKLGGPILDDVEYHEIMKSQEIMEGLS
jgi:hypothetical protein